MTVNSDVPRAIEMDLQAIENAIVILARTAHEDAVKRCTSGNKLEVGKQHNSKQSSLAILIADPINQVCFLGMETLRLHLHTILTNDEVNAMFHRALSRLQCGMGLGNMSTTNLQ